MIYSIWKEESLMKVEFSENHELFEKVIKEEVKLEVMEEWMLLWLMMMVK